MDCYCLFIRKILQLIGLIIEHEPSIHFHVDDRVFPRPSRHGGQVQGDKVLMGDIDIMGGLTLIDYIIN